MRIIDGASHEKLRFARSWPAVIVLIAAVLLATLLFPAAGANPASEEPPPDQLATTLDEPTAPPVTQPGQRYAPPTR